MTELIVLRSADEKSLIAEMNRLIAFLDRVSGVSLADIGYTCSLSSGPACLSIIASSTQELRSRLFSARSRLESGTGMRLRDKSGTYYFRNRLLGEGGGKLAFVYPGVMSFYPDMLRDIATMRPECRVAFDELEEAMMDNDDFTPSSFIFPPAPYYRQDADIFSSGAYAQALVSTYAGCSALARFMRELGVSPEGVVGFGGGDLAAMMRSGTVGEEVLRPTRVKIIREIYQIVDKAVMHSGLPEFSVITVILRHPNEIDELVKTFPPDRFMLTVDFSPRQKTYAVTKDFEETAMAAFAKARVRTVKLALNRPFNTPMCEKLVPAIKKFATGWMKHDPVRDIYSCATGEKLPKSLRSARADIASIWAKPVLFERTIRKMYDDGYRVFLEVGPRGKMTSAVEDTLRGEEHMAIALDSTHRRGMLQAQHALGQLAAIGCDINLKELYSRRKVKKLDFDAVISLEERKDTEMLLSRSFPRLKFLSDDPLSQSISIFSEPKGRGAKAAARAAAMAQQARRQRQFDFGVMYPLISDADTIESTPGVSRELTKVFKISEMPFIGDYSLGTSQMSYSDPNLKGLTVLGLSVGAEIMAEAAQLVVPKRVFLAIENFVCRRMVSFEKGSVKLLIKAERVGADNPGEAAVKVQIRDDSPNSKYTWPVMEATVVLTEEPRGSVPSSVLPLVKPRNVHWSGRDIYPQRLCCGKRLRGITFVESWSETGLDYEVEVPPLTGNITYTRFPMWVINPILFESVTSGFSLWRSHEKFTGAFSFPFRMRRFESSGFVPKEGASLKCYLRLTGVTPKSHVCDISVTEGNGKEIMSVSGWEEFTERVPAEYRALILQPATTFITGEVSPSILGAPQTDVASAFITDVPYPIFDRNEQLWLKTLSHIILGAQERKDFLAMPGSTARRTEWLFGRVVAKEAVRRFLRDNYQSRWSNADVQIWADDHGKPHAIGEWSDLLASKLDIAIAHTAQFVVAVAAANQHVGVDVESVARDLSREFVEGVFTPEEQELAAEQINASQALIRFWCAKEAVSKALGTGIRYSPREMLITGYHAESGRLTVRLEGAWVDAFKNFSGRDIEVSVATMRDHALAFCFIPSLLFPIE